MRTYALSLAIGLLITSSGNCRGSRQCSCPGACKEVQTCGAPDCCANCGSRGCCEKYCRVVCEMKEVKKIVWVVKCEDFCPLMPGCPLHCEEGCESCGKEGCKASSCEGCGKYCNPCASLEESQLRTAQVRQGARRRRLWRKKKSSARFRHINAWWFMPVQIAKPNSKTAGKRSRNPPSIRLHCLRQKPQWSLRCPLLPALSKFRYPKSLLRR